MQTVRRASQCVVDSKNPARRLAALAMAVALAAPIATVSVTFAQSAPTAEAPRLLAMADAPPADAGAAVQAAQALYDAKKYEEALTAAQAIKPESLSDADKKALADLTSKAQQATQLRRAARADFEMGQKALDNGDTATAATSFKNVANNPYADEGTRAKATEQLALASAGVKNGADTDWKAMYDEAVADYKAGNYAVAKPKFQALVTAGYTAPWFAKPPRDYIEQIDKANAGPSDAEQARAAYLTGRDQYRKGDWIAARQNFNKAVALNYKAGFFEDAPSKYLERMDKKEQADAAIAAKQNANQQANQKAVAVAAALPAVDGAAPADGTPATGPANDQDRLAANVAALNADKANKQAQAKQLAASAAAAEGAQRYDEAKSLYGQAYDLDPTNEDAKAGRARTMNLTGTSPVQENLGDRLAREIEARRQAVMFSFNQALAQADTQTKAGDFDSARTSIAQADAAAKQDTTLFKNEELTSFNTRVADARTKLEQAILADKAANAERIRKQAEEAASKQDADQKAAKERAVASLIADSRRLSDQGRYQESLKVVTQILVLDPKNEYANTVRPLLFDRASLKDQRDNRDAFDRNLVLQFNDADAKTIPYFDVLTYPPDWPDLSARRDKTLRDERQVSPQDEAVNNLLDKALPEIRFDQVSFSDVIDFLRDTTQANIFVNWKALEAAGIDRNAPVSTRLRNVKLSKVLRTILDSVGGGATVQLSYTVDEGVITISTTEDLAKNTETRTYDIRDLIIQIPDFTDVPQFSLQQSSGSRSGGSGGSGSSSSGNLFGGGGTGGSSQNNQNTQSREELVEAITGLIRETIGIGTWKEDGGSQGSLRELGGQLIVTQTPEVHRQITGLLQKLREQRSIQVMVEARFLTVQKNFLEDVGVDFDFYFNFDGNALAGIAPGGTIGTAVTNVASSGNAVNGQASGAASNVRTGATAAGFDPITGAATAGSAGSVKTGVAPIGVTQNSSVFTRASGLSTGVTGNLADSFSTPNLSTQVNAFLDDFQASLIFRATQGNQNVTQLTAPRLTLFNGQTANILVATQTAYVSDLTPVVGQSAFGFDPTIDTLSSGVALSVTATVSADRKYVTLTLQPQLSRVISISSFPVFGSATTASTTVNTGGGTTQVPTVDDTQSQFGFIQQPQIQFTQVHTTVSVPDGGTLLLGGTTITGEIEREAGVPVLSKIPFLKRAFTNKSSAKDEQVLLILVKPTIIIQREIEQQNFPLMTSQGS